MRNPLSQVCVVLLSFPCLTCSSLGFACVVDPLPQKDTAGNVVDRFLRRAPADEVNEEDMADEVTGVEYKGFVIVSFFETFF